MVGLTHQPRLIQGAALHWICADDCTVFMSNNSADTGNRLHAAAKMQKKRDQGNLVSFCVRAVKAGLFVFRSVPLTSVIYDTFSYIHRAVLGLDVGF